MGQYYRAVLIEKDENGVRIIGWLWRRGSLKLMEHSWLGNEFVRAIEYQISPEGPYPAGVRIVWAGDYADTEEDTGMNIYHMCDDNDGDGGDLMLYFPEHDNHDYRFVVNHSKRLFVDKETIQEEDDDDKGWKIHPLPLLTCEGNGRGGGDYRASDSQNLVGSWARDIVAVTRERPEGYGEVFFDLTERVRDERATTDPLLK